jgi:hypothetical protein
MESRLTITFAAVLAATLLPSVASGGARFTTLYNFPEGNATGLVLIDGALYGAAFQQATCGYIFELQPPAGSGGSWTQSVLYSFAATGDGCFPYGPPVRGAKGRLYGLTLEGGANRTGALYELLPPASPVGAWTESIVYSFDAQPGGALIEGPDGSFYVLCDPGVVFQLLPPAAPGVEWSGVELVPSSNYGRPWISAGPDGKLYGVTTFGGSAGRGSVDEITPPRAPGGTWTTTLIHSFDCCRKAANNPNTLTVASDGTIYGTTSGTVPEWYFGAGAAFSLTPPQSPGQEWTYTLLEDFGGKHPYTPLVLYKGNLYGALLSPNSDNGAVFELQPPTAPGGAWTPTYLHHFTGGQYPLSLLMVDNDGTIFGTTASDPLAPPTGTIYKIVIGTD